MFFTSPFKRHPFWAAVLLAVGQLFAGAFFAVVFVVVRDWLSATLTAVCLVGAGWHARQALKIRAAERYGAVPLPLTSPGAWGGARAPEAYEASLHWGPYAREGILFVVQGVSAFVPTSPWTKQAAHLLTALVPIHRVVMAQVPETAEALLHQVATREGVLVGAGWEWSAGRTMLVNAVTRELITVLMPGHAKEGWPLQRVTRDQRSFAFRIVGVVGALGALCVAAGGIASALTKDPDYFVAGIGWGAVFLIVGAVVYVIVLKRPRRT